MECGMPRLVRTKAEYEQVVQGGCFTAVVVAFMGSNVSGEVVGRFATLGKSFSKVAFMAVIDGSEDCTLPANVKLPAFKIFKDGSEVKMVTRVDDLIKELNTLLRGL